MSEREDAEIAAAKQAREAAAFDAICKQKKVLGGIPGSRRNYCLCCFPATLTTDPERELARKNIASARNRKQLWHMCLGVTQSFTVTS
jgi:hypothetical protein